MNIIEAWKKAEVGQQIVRLGSIIQRSKYLHRTTFNSLRDDVFLAEDWEIKKEKKTLVFENAELGGMIKNMFIQHFFDSANLNRPKIFTKIILEWEA